MQVRVMAKDRNTPKAKEAYNTITYTSEKKEEIFGCSNGTKNLCFSKIGERQRNEEY
jgi:hypothetical protein